MECLSFLDSCYKQLSAQERCSVGLYGLTTLGLDAYQKGIFSVVEIAFRILSDNGDSNGRNNCAYMLRRGEASSSVHNPKLQAIILLREGIIEKEPFSYVNEALTFCLCFGSDLDWQLADEIMKHLPKNNTMNIVGWWSDVAQAGEIEGFLVHFFLLRHDKIDQSSLGSIKSLAVRLKKSIKGFPEWLANDYSITTFDDVIECMGDSDFDSILDEFLESMPFSRDSADKMLRIIYDWDLLPVYLKLLTEYMSLLSQDEVAKLKSDYKEKFSIPLPDETE